MKRITIIAGITLAVLGWSTAAASASPPPLVIDGPATVQQPDEPLELERLRLTYMQDCGVGEGATEPPAEVRWRIRNSATYPLDYVLRQAGAGVVAEGQLAGSSETFVTTAFGARTLILETFDPLGGAKVGQDTKAGGDTFLTEADAPEKCGPPPTTAPPVTEPPTTEPPVTTVPEPTVPPVAPEAPVEPPAADQPPTLPETGSETTLAILAALMLAGGLGLARIARRPA